MFNDLEEWSIYNLLRNGKSLNYIKNIEIPQLQCRKAENVGRRYI